MHESVQNILSILLTTFAGFGVVMNGSSILVEFYRWRKRLHASLEVNAHFHSITNVTEKCIFSLSS